MASLIRNRPTDVAAIRQATLSVLGELGTADDLHGSNSSRLRRLSTALQKWNADGKHAEVLRAAQERMKTVCGGNAEGDVAAACRGFLAS